jgi:uncharacterized membrane protein YhdT
VLEKAKTLRCAKGATGDKEADLLLGSTRGGTYLIRAGLNDDSAPTAGLDDFSVRCVCIPLFLCTICLRMVQILLKFYCKGGLNVILVRFVILPR